MSDCCDFEPKFQVECLTKIVSLLRSGGRDRNQVLEIIQHSACFMGCGAELLKDQSPVGPIGINAAADRLESLIPKDDNLAQGPATSLPWLAILQILLPILLDLLKEE